MKAEITSITRTPWGSPLSGVARFSDGKEYRWSRLRRSWTEIQHRNGQRFNSPKRESAVDAALAAEGK